METLEPVFQDGYVSENISAGLFSTHQDLQFI